MIATAVVELVRIRLVCTVMPYLIGLSHTELRK